MATIGRVISRAEAVVILTRLSELELAFSKIRAILIAKARHTYKIPTKTKFFLYALADGLAYILTKITKKLSQLWSPPPKNQLSFNLAEVL